MWTQTLTFCKSQVPGIFWTDPSALDAEDDHHATLDRYLRIKDWTMGLSKVQTRMKTGGGGGPETYDDLETTGKKVLQNGLRGSVKQPTVNYLWMIHGLYVLTKWH